MARPKRFEPGYNLTDGDKLNISLANPQWEYATAVVAKAGGTQAAATLLGSVISSVDTVVTAADSVKLPPAVAGAVYILANTTATSMQVFGSGVDTINAVATATGVAQAGGVTALYVCIRGACPGVAGLWRRILSA